jgi:hypothetical protein
MKYALSPDERKAILLALRIAQEAGAVDQNFVNRMRKKLTTSERSIEGRHMIDTPIDCEKAMAE